jgi:SAM-dependent methyltransferase
MSPKVTRRRLQGVRSIVRFNWHFYAEALAAVLVLSLAGALAPGWLGGAALVAALAVAAAVSASLLASFYAYDASGFYRFDWLEPVVAGGTRAGNFHAGFDETSALLEARFAGIELQAFDFYDPERHTEVSIRRARKAQPPHPGTRSITTSTIPLPNASLDLALCILSAHEIRNRAERVAFFREIRRVLAAGGRAVVAEHFRDLPNILAYTVGAGHFLPRSEWAATFAAAGLRVVDELEPNALITVVMLERGGQPWPESVGPRAQPPFTRRQTPARKAAATRRPA